MNAEPKRPRQTCAYCGARNESVSTHSGILECGKCWNYRKMDRPAALHWAKVGEEFLSNVDMWDVTSYLPACGLTTDEMHTMIRAARKVRDHSKALVEKGPEHTWPKDESESSQSDESSEAK
jgi:hypothetical protein